MTCKEAILKLEILKEFSSQKSLKSIGEALDMAIIALNIVTDAQIANILNKEKGE